MGMQLEPWVVMSKLVMPETPSKGALDIINMKPLEEMIQDAATAVEPDGQKEVIQ